MATGKGGPRPPAGKYKGRKGRKKPPGTKPLRTGDRNPPRELSLPFAEGPIPPEYSEAVADLALFCKGLELELSEQAEERLARYTQRIFEANQVINLFRGAKTPQEFCSRHLGDCLVFRACLGGRERGRLLDVGTGAGLPAIPLAIACPDLEVVALDSTAKKTRFIQQVAQELELDNLTVLTERAEVLGHDAAYRGRFDVVVSRATAALPVLLELTVPFLKREGFLFASKGSRAEEEIEAAEHAFRELRCGLVSRETYPTMDPEVHFAMLIVQGLKPTPPRFPRHPSKIKNQPLGPVGV